MRLINTYDQCVGFGGDVIVLFYQRNEYGRFSRSAAFQVGRYKDGHGMATDPYAHWQDSGHKTFLVSANHREGETPHQAKMRTLAEAIQWVTKKYGKREFVRNRMGDWVEKRVNDKFPLPKRSATAKGEAGTWI